MPLTVVRILLAVLLAAPSAAVFPRPAAAAESATVLQEILEIMKKSGQITEEQRKVLIERAEQEARQAQAEQARAQAEREKQLEALVGGFTAGVENFTPYLRSRDGDFKFEPFGLLQLDFDADEPGAQALNGPALFNRFLVRRARLGFDGTLFRWVGIRVEAELTDGISLKDGYIEFRFLKEATLRGGQFKVPFSAEELVSDRFIDFIERSVINVLAPSREQGIMLYGSLFDGILGYSFGVFNGVPEEAPESNTGKELAGRLVVQPLRTTSIGFLKGLYLGGNVTWAPENDAFSSLGRTAARTSPQFVYFVAQPVNGNSTRFGGDLTWLWGPASLKLEYSEQINQRHGCGRVTGSGLSLACAGGEDLDELTAGGFLASVSYILTGEPKPFAGPVIPKRNFSPLPGRLGPGAWELALRYAQLSYESDDPVDFFDGNITNGITGGGATAENGVQALTAGVNWYLNPRTRLAFNWTNYWYDNELGTPFSCDLPSCGAAQLQEHGDTSWEVLTRMQVWF